MLTCLFIYCLVCLFAGEHFRRLEFWALHHEFLRSREPKKISNGCKICLCSYSFSSGFMLTNPASFVLTQSSEKHLKRKQMMAQGFKLSEAIQVTITFNPLQVTLSDLKSICSSLSGTQTYNVVFRLPEAEVKYSFITS